MLTIRSCVNKNYEIKNKLLFKQGADIWNQIKINQQMMKKGSFLLIALFLLNGCAESVALLGSASNGRILQSSLN